MKKIILIISIALFSCFAVQAQEVSPLKQNAVEVGLLQGIEDKQHEIKRHLTSIEDELNKKYDFNSLRVNGQLGLVIASEVQKENEVNVKLKKIQMCKEKNCVKDSLKWQDYLMPLVLMKTQPPEKIQLKTTSEENEWNYYYNFAYEKGQEEEASAFDNAYKQLDEDYNQILYYKNYILKIGAKIDN